MKKEKFKRKMDSLRRARARELRKVEFAPSQLPHDEWTDRTRAENLGKINLAEDLIDALLRQLPVTFVRERPIVIAGKRFFLDFLVVSMRNPRKKVRVAIEVDGGYHFTEEQSKRDRMREHELLKSSRVWSILRIEASVAMNMTGGALLKAIGEIPIWSIRWL